jgi:hypothetical protein
MRYLFSVLASVILPRKLICVAGDDLQRRLRDPFLRPGRNPETGRPFLPGVEGYVETFLLCIGRASPGTNEHVAAGDTLSVLQNGTWLARQVGDLREAEPYCRRSSGPRRSRGRLQAARSAAAKSQPRPCDVLAAGGGLVDGPGERGKALRFPEHC